MSFQWLLLSCSLSPRSACSFVDKFKPRNERMRDGPSMRFTNLYVKNFGDDFEEEQMKDLFAPFGTISSLVVMKDETGRSKGFGFVSYESHESAARAVDELNGKTFGDREIYVGRAMKKSERNAYLKRQFDAKRKERQQRFQGVNLYIKNLEEEIDDAHLREEFNKFGTITSAKVCAPKWELSLAHHFHFSKIAARDVYSVSTSPLPFSLPPLPLSLPPLPPPSLFLPLSLPSSLSPTSLPSLPPLPPSFSPSGHAR